MHEINSSTGVCALVCLHRNYHHIQHLPPSTGTGKPLLKLSIVEVVPHLRGPHGVVGVQGSTDSRVQPEKWNRTQRNKH